MLDRAKRIVRRPQGSVPSSFPGNLHPVLARLFVARGISDASQLEHGLGKLHSFRDLTGIEEAVDILAVALKRQQRILVIGDFDADGATSTTVTVRGLRMMGAGKVDFLVPNRFEFGYGLTPEIVAEACKRQPDLIVTVDNGISSIEGVKAANAAGIPVLVTDHHLPGEQLPEAAAIVNPNQCGDIFPSKALAGVGVIFYVMMALRARLRSTGWFTEQGVEEPNLGQLLDVVALGTVADVVPLDHNNRILVAQGLARIRAGRCCPGIKALVEVSGRQVASLASADLGFALGPRLNAAGRLDDMSVGIRCLLSDSISEARMLAAELDSLNKERRAIEQEMREDALAELQRMHLENADNWPLGVCLYNSDWHQGVIGILASRIKDRVHRPVIVFTDAGENEIKGSARSIPGLHIRDALDAVAARHPELLHKFGGHAMAAGLSLARENFPSFSDAFDKEVRRHLSESDIEGVIVSDGELSSGELDLELAELVRRAVPWGQDFPEPLFDGIFHVVERRVVGECHLKLVLRWPDDSRCVDGIMFNAGEAFWVEAGSCVRLAYRVGVNEFRGERSVQLVVEHIERFE